MGEDFLIKRQTYWKSQSQTCTCGRGRRRGCGRSRRCGCGRGCGRKEINHT